MKYDSTETTTVIYENSLENFKRAATYLTKFNVLNIYHSIPSMKKESFLSYFDTINRLREVEYTGSFREKREYVKTELIALYDSIFIPYGTTPAKIFEYKTSLRSDGSKIDDKR